MNLKLQTAHHHQPEAQGSVHPWCSLLWEVPHLLWITHRSPLQFMGYSTPSPVHHFIRWAQQCPAFS